MYIRMCAARLFTRGLCAVAARGHRVFPLACADYAGGDVSAYNPVLAVKYDPLPFLRPPVSGGKDVEHYHHDVLDFFRTKLYNTGTVY